MSELSQPGGWLPMIFLGLMGLAMLIYVVLDGYDLGVGILLRRANEDQKDMMIASIGPFWDANETWLVLGVGILLTAFPLAHGVILGELYLPVALMLGGLILRGVAFDFRVKAHADHKSWWNLAFYLGSLITAGSQGVMLGRYITGFAGGIMPWVFAVFVGAGVASGYCLLGASWLLMKTEGDLQARAVVWARGSLWLTAAGVLAISIATPLVSERIFDKWFSFPNLILLAPIPIITVLLFALIFAVLRHLPSPGDRWCWLPFVATVLVFVLAFLGLAFSLLPYLIMEKMTIWQGAASTEALKVILFGVLLVLPMILLYTAYSYWVFWGKARELRYL